MKIYECVLTAGIIVALSTGACGGAKGKDAETVQNPKGPKNASGKAVAPEAEKEFNAALDDMNAHDKAGDWSDSTCKSVAEHFDSAAKLQGKGFPEASYDAGLVYQRCGADKDAKAHFEQALQADDKFHYARAQLALYQFKADSNVDAAITALERSVEDARFNDVPALVDLAMFQMQRDSDTVGSTCKTDFNGQDAALKDFECAKTNLQRALAIDDSYMPAFNQLALYYFSTAKKRAAAGGKGAGAKMGRRQIATNAAMGRRADVQQLELASLVASQAIRKNPKYAPIQNTAGLILYELGQVNGAVTYFSNASTLDTRFFEAHMNLAAVNLSFRGFDKAEGAYKKALEIHANDYDAHLGLALAYRGQIDDTNYDKQVGLVQSELDICKKLDPNRPDAFFNEGILTEEFKAKSGGDKAKTVATLKAARDIYKDFVGKASGKDEYAGAVKKANERMQDIGDKITFLETPDAAPAAPPPPASSGAAPAAGGSAAAPTPAPSASANP